MEALIRRLKDQEGMAVVIAIIAMLVLGVIGVSFAILANLETKIGINQKQEIQALAIAETGLEHARNMIRSATAAAGVQNFDPWVRNPNGGKLIINGQAYGGGTYSVRIDNDCSSNHIVPPDPLPNPPYTIEDEGCFITPTPRDSNLTAALTAWATTSNGLGRARVRVLLTYTDPWKRSCYNSDGVLCTNEPEGNPNATVIPSDPNHPNGPATGDLPVPNNLVCGSAIRKPAGNPSFGATDCVMNPYYDKALDTPCPMCSPPRQGCAANAGTPADPCPDWGMVFPGTVGNPLHGADIKIGSVGGAVFRCAGDHLGGNHPGCPGVANVGVIVYVMGKVELANNGEVNGTLVVHGNGNPGTTGKNIDINITGRGGLWAIPTPTGCPTPASCGYPLALLIYDPSQAALPQNTYADISNANSEIHGIVYSAGEVAFNPITVDGGVVAYKSYLSNAASSITYNPTYGNAAPPPGFSTVGGGSFPAVARYSWIHCRDYSDETSGPTACN